MYRPLSENERAIVTKTIYGERQLTGGLAESMFMAYTGRALALDEPEYDIFLESEKERKARLAEKQRNNVVKLKGCRELDPTEYFRELDALTNNDRPITHPENCFVWFYGDESFLDIRHKRLRVKFFNSLKYRKQVLHQYLDDSIILETQLNDTKLIGELLGDFHRKYSGTRTGLMSFYEIFFGDPSGFSYMVAMQRQAFHNDPAFRMEFLKKRNLPDTWSINDIREHLKRSALDTKAATIAQITQWEIENTSNH